MKRTYNIHKYGACYSGYSAFIIVEGYELHECEFKPVEGAPGTYRANFPGGYVEVAAPLRWFFGEVPSNVIKEGAA